MPFDRDDFVKVKGLTQVYQNRQQFTIHRLRRLDDAEVDFADYFPCSQRDAAEMFAELQGIIAGIGSAPLRGLLQATFADQRIADLYQRAPAAKSIHHAWRGGLLEHVLSLCTLCRMTAAHYRNIDLDLLLTGAIYHDIGKIEELTYERSFGYSSEGQLLGHIIIGLRMLDEKAREVPDFPPKLRSLIEHMLISHHGELEYGSPKVPLFLEALLLHHLDNLDSKMETMRVAVERDRLVDGEFTGWVSPLERVILKKERYLSGEPPKPPSYSPAMSGSPVMSDMEFELTPPASPASSGTGPSLPSAPAVPAAPALPAAPAALPFRAAPAVASAAAAPPPARPVKNTVLGDKLQAFFESQKQ